MIPKIRVSPAASRNSSMPSWMPFRHCSMKYSMVSQRCRPEAPPIIQTRSGRMILLVAAPQKRRPAGPAAGPAGWASVRHLALVVVRILVVLHDPGHGLQPVIVADLHHVLQIEALARDMVRAGLD